MKGVLILTALSFMSLFGISGYLGSAGKNKTVIKVDDIEITQNQISNELNQEMQKVKNFMGDNVEMNENIRFALLQGLVQKELYKAILDKTAQDNNVHISDNLIKVIIATQPDFMEADGKFSSTKMRRLLAAAGISEQTYINNIKEEIKKQHLVYNPVENVNVPAFMADYLNKIETQKKVFKYVKIDPDKMKIDRNISQDELEQYYNDFAPQFVEPESRDVSFIALSTDDIAGQIKPTEEEIAQYYNDNLSQYVVPENRQVLQMVFDTKEAADNALTKLKQTGDFYAVAKSEAKQDKASTDLGYVSKEMLIADMGDAVFALKKGDIAGPVKSEFGWHIMKVTDIKPMEKTSMAAAKGKIIETLRKEQAYDEAYKVSTEIEDQIGSGKTLPQIAQELNAKVWEVKGLGEDGGFKSAPTSKTNLVKSADFIDTAFSYNVNEVSQVIETDEGFAVLVVNNIKEQRQKDLDEVKTEIIKMWENNEKAAITQEVVNDVINDAENGDKLEDIARRFKLSLQTTKPLSRKQNFENLPQQQMQELFKEEINAPKVFNLDGIQIVAVADRVINSNVPLSRADVQNVRYRSQASTMQDMAAKLMDDYGSNYRIRVKYKYLGLAD